MKLKQNLHILFLCSWYPSRVLRTNGDFIQRHAEAVAIKHKVTIIHVKTDNKLTDKIEITDKIINGIRTLIAYVKPSRNLIIKKIRFKKAFKALLNKVVNIDIVHVNKLFPAGLIAYRLKKRKKIPYIISEHHSIYQKIYNHNISFIEKLISKLIVKNASYVCPVTNDLGQAMRTFGLKGNYYNVPNVVDTTIFLPKTEVVTKGFTLLHVSSMVKLKNIEGILRVVKKIQTKVPLFHFNLIGGNAQKFKNYAIKIGINLNAISFINQVPHTDLINYFQNADAFVLFSDSENLPCVILESFSCGTPVVSTNVGGISEYFPKNFGILIKSNNEDELLRAILKIQTDFKKEKSKKMHKYVVENFSKKYICCEFTNLYVKALKTTI
ncbi:MAG: glycosyltransferase family 4 protein [Flavobacteriaceae bacterium]|nr:glycosyltransferase family 4 protein [Flavobacteriaceae bacterium]